MHYRITDESLENALKGLLVNKDNYQRILDNACIFHMDNKYDVIMVNVNAEESVTGRWIPFTIKKSLIEEVKPVKVLSPLDGSIIREQYHRFEGTTMVVCCLTMDNGYHVTGESSCAVKENFDIEMAYHLAFEKAKVKVNALKAFRQMDDIYKGY